MKSDMEIEDKIIGLERLQNALKAHRQRKERIVFTNGCFDILHVGHVRYLSAAKALGGILMVGLNSDASVRRIKGKGRPINSETDRAVVLAALVCVDYVVVFEEPDPLHLIQTLEPDVLVKGADWETAQIVGADRVLGRGGEVIRIPLVEGVSTSGIIEKIRKAPAR